MSGGYDLPDFFADFQDLKQPGVPEKSMNINRFSFTSGTRKGKEGSIQNTIGTESLKRMGSCSHSGRVRSSFAGRTYKIILLTNRSYFHTKLTTRLHIVVAYIIFAATIKLTG